MRSHLLLLAIGVIGILAACDSDDTVQPAENYDPYRQPVPAGSWALPELPMGATVGTSNTLAVVPVSYPEPVSEYELDGTLIGPRKIEIEGQIFAALGIEFTAGKYYLIGSTFSLGQLIVVCNENWQVLRYWSVHERSESFVPFVSMAVDAYGHVYQVASDDETVFKYRSDGTFVKKWLTHGNNPGERNNPGGIAIGPRDDVYISDTPNHRILVFSIAGELTNQWGKEGTKAGEFGWPNNIAADEHGDVYVVDRLNYRIQKFDRDGDYLLEFPSTAIGPYDTTPYGLDLGSGSLLVFHASGIVNRFILE